MSQLGIKGAKFYVNSATGLGRNSGRLARIEASFAKAGIEVGCDGSVPLGAIHSDLEGVVIGAPAAKYELLAMQPSISERRARQIRAQVPPHINRFGLEAWAQNSLQAAIAATEAGKARSAQNLWRGPQRPAAGSASAALITDVSSGALIK